MKAATMFLLIAVLVSGFQPAPAHAAETSSGLKEGASSLLIPGWGQYQNGEFQNRSGRIKSGAMILIEIGAIITTAVVGGVAGYPAVWAGIGLFIANHVWSGIDAFMNAEKEPGVSLGTQAPQDKVNTF